MSQQGVTFLSRIHHPTRPSDEVTFGYKRLQMIGCVGHLFGEFAKF
jgi:hypothetical protein